MNKSFKIFSKKLNNKFSDTLDKNLILNALKYKHSIEIFSNIDSTNNYIKLNHNKMIENHIVISNEQSKGRGKGNNTFLSPKDCGIYMSIYIKPKLSIKESLKLTILSSVAVHSAIKKLYGIKTQLKWINDVFINNYKIAGILCESSFNLKNNYLDYIVVGIGVNVKKMTFPSPLDTIASSIENNTNIELSRNLLISEIINYFDLYYFNNLDYMSIYKENCFVLGKEILVKQNNQEYYAIAKDIDENGFLIIEKDSKIISLNSGEISIRTV